MKRDILSLLVIFLTSFAAKADTIDYWHVYYNDSLIQKFNIHNDSAIVVIKVKNIHDIDSLGVRYFYDTPCSDCPVYLIVRTDKKGKLIFSKAIGTGSFLSFNLKMFKNSNKKSENKYFEVLYAENAGRPINTKLLFLLKFE